MSQTIKSLKVLFERDLGTLKKELMAYEDESQLWLVEGAITNSAGNLVLHLCGNLKHFIGAVLGDSGYIRERDREFGDKNVSRAEMAKSIDEAREIVLKTLDGLTDADLDKIYEVRVFNDKPITTHIFLLHLSGHLMYHLGQINYHRRLLTAQ
ncbi:MAG: hypothetical protein Roseis2KO_00550 [Roseivirga sp.]